jgi:succinyl-CoA synthetase beta subunit
MDLLEYQGKQLFARHGVPVPDGRPARTVEEAVAAAEEIGYPCVVKAQVQIGGRGKLGGIKVCACARSAQTLIPPSLPRPDRSRGLDRRRLADRLGVLRLGRL